MHGIQGKDGHADEEDSTKRREAKVTSEFMIHNASLQLCVWDELGCL